ncbi:MAG: Rpn family recombination-promoting nuclease/putative transposase [Treponema sp.]|jgi:predicted transposase/invertase (TIGR01784 family)|nr:Rpn family recombination-promoting nuclease/putative transposase [Treponema sp.]
MQKILSPLNDFVFKLIFGDKRHSNILAAFLKATLDLPTEEFDRLVIADPHLNREHTGDKTGILDVKVHTKSGVIINVEVQVASYAGLRNRFVFYPAKLLVSQAKRGAKYRKLAPVVSIIIMEELLVPEDEGYYNEYGLINKRTGTVFSDVLRINVLELSKLPQSADMIPSGERPLWQWGRFFQARTEEEFKMAAEQGGAIREAVDVLMEVSEDELAQMRAIEREIFLMDQASREDYHEEIGYNRGLAKGLAKGLEKGRQEGEAKGRKILDLMRQGYTVEQIEAVLASQTR